MAVEVADSLLQRQGAQRRRLPIGAEVHSGAVHFRVWAPRRKSVEVVVEGGVFANGGKAVATSLQAEPNGYFSGLVDGAADGTLYRFRLDGGEKLYPDPASRYQPQGPHGPSQVVHADRFAWSDADWKGISPAGQVLYELHIGTFTPAGTWAAATAELPRLAQLGITCLEVMPVNEFAGAYGWGYDGVDLFAPFHHYGTPDDFRRFVDAAHKLGVAVILDVVYNHMGPDGNYVREFSADYFNAEHMTDWGEALNFDGKNADGTREFFISNAVYWISEFHLDGFRFDATQAIVDTSPEHILSVICRRARQAAGERGIYLINENEPQHTKLVRPVKQGGFGLDALWNDDFHHSAMVVLSGRNEAYYTDYFGTPQEFISAAKYGYLYQGQRYKWQQKRRGTPALDLPPTAFVHFLQNHDQVANSGRGQRLHDLSSPGQLRAMTALLLLMPQTPMLFQGQEWAASSTFHYFADHNDELKKLIKAGRAKELSQFPSLATRAMQAALIDPGDRHTFERSRIDSSERERPRHAEVYRLHQELLRLRREEPAFARAGQRGQMDGSVLPGGAFLLRFFGEPDGGGATGVNDRLLLVNFGVDLQLDPAPDPLLAPPADHRWSLVFSTEEPEYGGTGTPPPDTEREGWFVPGRSAVLLKPVPADAAAVMTRVVHPGSAQEARRRADQAQRDGQRQQ
jgi:maltooligosyltrehalose trehalohydrolase